MKTSKRLIERKGIGTGRYGLPPMLNKIPIYFLVIAFKI
jgi:hypothetical protein